MSFPIPRSLPRLVRSYGTVQGPPSAASIAGRVPGILVEATNATTPRITWTREEVSQIYNTPLNQLTYASVSSQSYGIHPGSHLVLQLHPYPSRNIQKEANLIPPRLPCIVVSTTHLPSKCAH